MIDILFLQIPDTNTYKFSNKNRDRKMKLRMCPLGLLYLASYCREKGYNPYIIDLGIYPNREKRKEAVIKFIKENNPKVIGISSYTADYNEFRYISRVCKNTSPSTPVLFGGPHATFTYKESLETNPIDIVIRFEGEIILIEVLDYYLRSKGDLSQIEGIAYIEDGDVKVTKKKKFIQNLDILPYPARDLIDLDRYLSSGIMLSSRGCIGRCIFCTAAAMSGSTQRVRSVENIIGEVLEMYYKYKIKHLNFVDDTFTVYKERNIEFCRRLKELNLGITFDCESRVDCVDEELLKEMKAAGCVGIQFGVESGDQFVLNKINKGIDLEQVRKAVKLANKVGIEHIFCGFMIGHPEDTKESIERTIDFMMELKAKGVALGVSITTPFPGTYLYKNLQRLGCKLITNEWSNYTLDQCIFETKNLNRREIKKLHVRAGEIIYDEQSSKNRI
ncbi:B12-binding domain-containing radical SAM protein [Abyssisolibacter fermentans]|uniref:B12-binding domain-containing radical SAM protein n=1 Tax=Abyssisolibacter fermentans TaxID=1766203 RepID=UPI000830B07F|nr:radical SAM protein [Abyssisolibacter fermentans]